MFSIRKVDLVLAQNLSSSKPYEFGMSRARRWFTVPNSWTYGDPLGSNMIESLKVVKVNGFREEPTLGPTLWIILRISLPHITLFFRMNSAVWSPGWLLKRISYCFAISLKNPRFTKRSTALGHRRPLGLMVWLPCSTNTIGPLSKTNWSAWSPTSSLQVIFSNN